jgi:hypothetical protein
MSGSAPTAVYTLAVYNNLLIAGGRFDAPGVNIAAWNGLQWAPLGAGLGSASGDIDEVFALTVYNGELIAGGIAFASPVEWLVLASRGRRNKLDRPCVERVQQRPDCWRHFHNCRRSERPSYRPVERFILAGSRQRDG